MRTFKTLVDMASVDFQTLLGVWVGLWASDWTDGEGGRERTQRSGRGGAAGRLHIAQRPWL